MDDILYLDTSGSVCTVALSINGRLTSIRRISDSKAQSAEINGLIESVLQESGMYIKDLSAISVINGPGSYTGLRVSLATAKGLAFPHNIPLILHHKLQLMALSHQVQNQTICALLYARDQECFGYLMKDTASIIPPRHFYVSELKNNLQGYQDAFIVTDRQEVVDSLGMDIPYKIIPDGEIVDIDIWIEESQRRLALFDFDDLAYSEPFYLKAAFTTQQKK